LVEFNGQLTDKAVKLTWKTASELDNQGFVLFRNGKQLASYRTNGQLAGRGTTSDETLYGYTDWAIDTDKEYSYRLRSVDVNGQVHDYPDAVVVRPYENKLEQNHPNPFNPMTTISFDLAEDCHVSLCVYDISGRLVKTLVRGRKPPQRHAVRWLGTDDHDRRVASGVYLCRLETPSFSATRKLLVVR
jgi:hypothetical protein